MSLTERGGYEIAGGILALYAGVFGGYMLSMSAKRINIKDVERDFDRYKVDVDARLAKHEKTVGDRIEKMQATIEKNTQRLYTYETAQAALEKKFDAALVAAGDHERLRAQYAAEAMRHVRDRLHAAMPVPK